MTSKTNAFSQLKRQAKHGDPQAIATLMNRSFQRRGVTAFVTTKGNCLQVLLESEVVPRQSTFVSMIWMGVHKLEIANINTIEIYGKQSGNEIPCWIQKITLDHAHYPEEPQHSISIDPLNNISLSSPRTKSLAETANIQSREPQKSPVKNQSNFLSNTLMRFELRSAIYGLLMDIIGTECSSFVLTILFSIMLAMQGKNYYQIQSELAGTNFLVVYIVFGLLFSGTGGFLSAHCAKHDQVLNAALTGSMSTSLGFLMTYTVHRAASPNFLDMIALVLIIPVAIAGGCLRKATLRRHMQTA